MKHALALGMTRVVSVLVDPGPAKTQQQVVVQRLRLCGDPLVVVLTFTAGSRANPYTCTWMMIQVGIRERSISSALPLTRM